MRTIFFIIALIAIAQIAYSIRISKHAHHEDLESNTYTSFDTFYDLSTPATSYNPLQDPIYKLRFLRNSLKTYEGTIDELKVQPGNEKEIKELKKVCKSVKEEITATTEECIHIAKSACKQVKQEIQESKDKNQIASLKAHLTHLETLIDTLKRKKISPKQKADDLRYANFALKALVKQLEKKITKTKNALADNEKALKRL